MDIQVNKPKITRVWFPIRVFQQDIDSTITGKIVTLGFGQKCVVTVRQGGLSGTLPTTTFVSLTHALSVWRYSLIGLIDTHMIQTGVIEDMSDVKKAQFIESLLDIHGIESRPIDVFNKFRRDIEDLAELSEEINYD